MAAEEAAACSVAGSVALERSLEQRLASFGRPRVPFRGRDALPGGPAPARRGSVAVAGGALALWIPLLLRSISQLPSHFDLGRRLG